jgi:hypothetical protein
MRADTPPSRNGGTACGVPPYADHAGSALPRYEIQDERLLILVVDIGHQRQIFR